MNREEFVRICGEYAEGKDFRLNPDKAFLDDVISGVLAKEKTDGLRLCPCRLAMGSVELDWELLCPCYFQKLDVWPKEGRCWCGLFVKR